MTAITEASVHVISCLLNEFEPFQESIVNSFRRSLSLIPNLCKCWVLRIIFQFNIECLVTRDKIYVIIEWGGIDFRFGCIMGIGLCFQLVSVLVLFGRCGEIRSWCVSISEIDFCGFIQQNFLIISLGAQYKGDCLYSILY